MHDRDSKFCAPFTQRLRESNVRTNVLPKASPNLNGRVERAILTLKHECLSKFILFGKKHLDYLLADFVNYYNEHRSHMEREHLPPRRKVPEEIDALPLDRIEVRSHVGGLVKSFHQRAA